MREVEQQSAVQTMEQDAEFQRLFEYGEGVSEALQKTVLRQAAELEELRTLRRKYQEQARELEELREKVMVSPSEASKHGEWVQQPCRRDSLDTRQVLVDVVRPWTEIGPERTTLFDADIGHVVIVLPPLEPLPGSWIRMVRAVSMWMARGCIVYLVAGPRTIDDDAWYRVAAQARNHVNSFVHAHPQYQRQLVDKLPTMAGAANRGYPSFAIGVLETQDDIISERNARLFYTVCARQLAHLVTLEPLPSKGPRTRGVDQSHPLVKKSKIEKRRLRKQAQKMKKKAASAPCSAMP